jgi:hypothetical protein
MIFSIYKANPIPLNQKKANYAPYLEMRIHRRFAAGVNSLK